MTSTAAIAEALAGAMGVADAVQVGTTLDVEFAWVPRLELGDTDDMIVTVLPFSRNSTNLSRNSTEREHQIQIGVTERVVAGQDPNTLFNSVNAWAERIHDWTEGIDLGIEGVYWLRSDFEFLAVPENLRELRQITCGIVVTFRERGTR